MDTTPMTEQVKKRKPYVTRRRFGSDLKTTTVQGKRDYMRDWLRAKRKAEKIEKIKAYVLGHMKKRRKS